MTAGLRDAGMIGDWMAESPPPPFAMLLRKLRTDAGLTQEKLAEAAQISYRSVSDLERGVNRSPRNDTARLLADALRLTGDDRAAFESAARGHRPAAGRATEVPHRSMAAATRTLPRDIASFTGRQLEIESLRVILRHLLHNLNIRHRRAYVKGDLLLDRG
jgi:transcriptional regulator with XRE-family HTH domain